MNWLFRRYYINLLTADSPYSPEATEALKMAFGAEKWLTIRDYGWGHPALIPFINEDPMLVMSLIEGLGTRWIASDGVAIIDTGYYATQNTHVTCKANFSFGINNPCFFGGRTGYDGAMVGAYYIGDTGTSERFIFAFGNKHTLSSSSSDPSYIGVHVYDVKNGVLKIDGITKLTVSTSVFTSQRTFCICGYNDGYNNGYMPATTPILYLELEDGTTSMNWVPCKHIVNGVLKEGMLDVISQTWKGNANSSGSFTISETPAT